MNISRLKMSRTGEIVQTVKSGEKNATAVSVRFHTG